jgi:hypothetical protein
MRLQVPRKAERLTFRAPAGEIDAESAAVNHFCTFWCQLRSMPQAMVGIRPPAESGPSADFHDLIDHWSRHGSC